MQTICGMDCCCECQLHGAACAGCQETSGHPCGGSCVAAELFQRGGAPAFLQARQQLINECNALGLPGLQVSDMHLMMGQLVDLTYPLPNGTSANLLRPNRVYFVNQLPSPDSGRCYGIAADETMLLVCTYGAEGREPELLLFKRR